MKFFLPEEVERHNKASDFWVILHGNVLDLTKFLARTRKHFNYRVSDFLSLGGTDMSNFFTKDGSPIGEAATEKGRQRFLLPPLKPVRETRSKQAMGFMWTRNPLHRIGRITRRPRQLRVFNTVANKTDVMNLCDEDTFIDIQRKYKRYYNTNCYVKYVWRKFSCNENGDGLLKFNGTLDENGLRDEKIDDDRSRPPAVWLFNQDTF